MITGGGAVYGKGLKGALAAVFVSMGLQRLCLPESSIYYLFDER